LRVNPRVGWTTPILLVVVLCSVAEPARADYIFTPFIGAAFGGATSFLNLEQGAGSAQVIFGGSAGWLSSGILGVEGDFAYSPRFFERDNLTILASTAATVSGSVIVAAPLRVTGYSLRPYLVGGLGLIHSGITYSAILEPVDDNSLGMNIGAGAIGLLSPRTGLRFELRHFRTFSRDVNEATGDSEARLSFWRATIGVLIRR
jgi:Outer membrane protein beta-barrel domain